VDFGGVLKACATGAGPSLFHTHGNADCQNTRRLTPTPGKKTTLDGREKILIADLAPIATRCARHPADTFRAPGASLVSTTTSQSFREQCPNPSPSLSHLFTNTLPTGGCDAGSTVKFLQENVGG